MLFTGTEIFHRQLADLKMAHGRVIEWFYDSLPSCVGLWDHTGRSDGECDVLQRSSCSLCDSRRHLLRTIPKAYKSYKDLKHGDLTEEPTDAAERHVTAIRIILQVGYNKYALDVPSGYVLTVSAFLDDLCCQLLLAMAGGRYDMDDDVAVWWEFLEDAVEALGMHAVLGIGGDGSTPLLRPLITTQCSPHSARGASEHEAGCLFPLRRWIAVVRHICRTVDGVVHLPSCDAAHSGGPNAGDTRDAGGKGTTGMLLNGANPLDSLLSAVKLLCSCLSNSFFCHVPPVCGLVRGSQAVASGGDAPKTESSAQHLIRLAIRTNIITSCRRHVATALGDSNSPPVTDEALREGRCSTQSVLGQLILLQCTHEEGCVGSEGEKRGGCFCWLLVASSLVGAAFCVLVDEEGSVPLHTESFLLCFVQVAIEEWKRKLQRYSLGGTEGLELLTHLFRRIVYQLQLGRLVDIFGRSAALVPRILSRQYVLASTLVLPNTVGNINDGSGSAAAVTSWLLDHAIRRWNSHPSLLLPCWCRRGDAVNVVRDAPHDDEGALGDELLIRTVLTGQHGDHYFLRTFVDHCAAARRGRLGSGGSSPLAEIHYYSVMLNIVRDMMAGDAISFLTKNDSDANSSTTVGNDAFPRYECLRFFNDWMAVIRKELTC